jgi:hypothetical protein
MASFQISTDDFEQLLGRILVQGAGVFFGINEMGEDVILDDLRHEAGRGTAHPRQQMHHLFAASLGFEGTLDGFDLAAYAAHAR